MNSSNEFLARLVALADANGWLVSDYDAEMPGSITLVDSSGTKVHIYSRHGLDMPYYIEQLKARPRDKASVFK